MSRPPLGTRWGDLSPEQRAALPVGTRLLAFDGIPELTRTDWGWADAEGTFYFYPSTHQRIVYPAPASDPRNSDGPDSDEGGGEMRTGDDDTGRGPAWRCSCGYGYPLGHPRCPKCCRYPVRDCEGAEDAPRDCLPG